MKHLKKLSILALLLTAAVQGAWAQTVELKPFTVPESWNGDETAVTAADLPNDFGAVSFDVAKQITIPNAPSDEIEVVIYGISDDQKLMDIDLYEGKYAGNTIVTKKKIYEKLTWGYKIYYTVAQPAPAAQPVDLTEVTAGKEWKIESMPAANVELQVEYEPEYSATFKALTANTIGTAATVKLDNVAIDTLTAEKNTLNGIYPGQTVTLTAATGYKFRKVEAKKGLATTLDGTTTTWSDDTFVVPAGGLTYSGQVTISGDVTLTLPAGTTLTFNGGLYLDCGATLTIEGEGAMEVFGTKGYDHDVAGGDHGTTAGSGTGAIRGCETSKMIVNGGTITATGGDGGDIFTTDQMAQECNGGNGGIGISIALTVNGGTLTAKGGNGGSHGGSWSGQNGSAGKGISSTFTAGTGITFSESADGTSWTTVSGTSSTMQYVKAE